MNIQPASSQKTVQGSSESFTGVAWQQTVAVGETAEPLHVSRVTFEPGARTVWHRHALGQVLIVISGIGRFQLEGGPVLALQPGDSVTIGPGERHWHGAAPDQLFVHLSLQNADVRGEQAMWLEPVTEENYRHDPQ